MVSFKKLTSQQLQEMLKNASTEVQRREKIKSATDEIRAILKQYDLSYDDIDRQLRKIKKPFNRKKSRAKKQASDNRKVVQPKYANPNGIEVWSGRGRAPSWVNEICREEAIDLATFKREKLVSKA